MKNIRFFTIGLLSLVTLAACSPANSVQPTKTASSSRKPIKQSSTKASSSKSSSTSSDSSSSDDFSDRFSLDPDDSASLQYVPGAASIPEIEKLKNLHPTTGFVLRTEDGQEVGGPKERSSYDDVVAAFGQPVSSTDSANPGDGVNVWATDNGDIMAVFHNNVLTDITFRLKGAMPTTSLLAAFPNPIHQKQPSNVSENPMPLCVQKMGPAMSIKIATEMNLASLHKEIRSSMLRLLQKPSS